MEYFDVYDRYGEKTSEVVEREEAHRTGTFHRVIHLWILNSGNEVLIQQRSSAKDVGANLWYISVSGHIEDGEGVRNALIRETREEIGLDIEPFIDSVEYLYTFKDAYTENNGTYRDNEFCDVFALKKDFDISQIIMQQEEVQAVKYISFDELKGIIMNQDKSFWHHKMGYKMLLVALEEFFGLK